MKNKICIVAANYYPKISKNLIIGAVNELKKNGFKVEKNFFVPGIFEIPLLISRKINSWDAFIALGCVIRGKTPHFNLISSATTLAIMNLSVEHRKPIGNGIIVCFNKKQAQERSKLYSKKKKGREAAKAVLTLLKITK